MFTDGTSNFKITLGTKSGLDHRSVQQQFPFSSNARSNGVHSNPRQYRSVYEKTYNSAATGRGAWGVNRAVSLNESNSVRNRMAAKEVGNAAVFY